MKTTDIEVNEAEILGTTNPKNSEMETKQKTIDQMSPDEIKQYLADIEKKQKEELRAEKNKFEADKNDFLKHSASKFQHFHRELKELKEVAISQANELYDRMYRIEGEEPRETKSFSLKNSEDTVKITVERQERFEFTEAAIVHINAIKDLFKDKYANRNKRMYGYLDELLIKGKSGEYDPKLLVKIRRKALTLEDEDMLNLIDKLTDCQRIRETALYCRLYIKDQESKKYKDVSLNFSSF